MTIRLRVPAVAEHPDPAAELRPVYVEEWVESLPFADPVSLLRNLHRAIARLNRTPVRPATRFALMEVYLRPYRYLLELEEQHSAAPGATAFERNRAETDATRQVTVELGYGYKHVLADSLGARSARRKSKHVAPALQRAALCLAHTLLHSYHQYLPTPKHLWTELAELYRYASDQHMHALPNSNAHLPPEFAASLEHLYKRILLVSLVDPHHLAYGEVWQVYGLVGSCTDEAQITPLGPVPNPAGVFVLDPSLDQRPMAYAAVAPQALGAASLLLNARPAIRALHRQATQARPNGTAASIAERGGLAGRVMNAWGRPPRRHDQRAPTQGQVSVTTGLASVHHFLGGVSADPPADSAAQSAPAADDIEIGGAPASSVAGFGAYAYALEHWDLVDQGRRGICVIRQVRPKRVIGVGELVGVQFGSGRERGGDWTVGVVRWLRIENRGAYQAGVQLLAERPEPVSVLVEQPAGGAPARASAILVAAGDRQGTLIVPAGTFSEGQAVLVESPQRTMRVSCGSMLESTPSFDRGNFEVAG